VAAMMNFIIAHGAQGAPPRKKPMRQHTTNLLLCLALLLANACRGVRPTEPVAPGPARPVDSTPASEPAGADFLSISRPGSSYQARWTDVSLYPDKGGFRTDLSARAASPREGDELVEVHFTIIQLRGPGEYPLGFGWSRGKSRVTIQTREGMRCMTPLSDAGVIEVTAAPAGGELAPGDRLEGRYRVHCFPEGDTTSREEALVFTGAFAVTVLHPRQ
jgi:hypothetical protein